MQSELLEVAQLPATEENLANSAAITGPRFRIETPAKPSSGVAVQLSMVRHGKNFAFAALMATVLAIPASQSAAQATTPAPANQQTAASPKTPAASATAAKTRTHHKKATAKAEVPQTPPPPPTLEQQSPTAPQVSYHNGQLTIDASNSTLSSILRAVQLQTGATMDLPSGASGERVAMRLGPGQPRDVLHTLLNGSKFDYMILGVAGNPGAIQKVILTPKQAAGAAGAQASNNAQPTASDDQDEGTPVADTGGESEYPGPTADPQSIPPGAIRRPGAPGAQFNRPGDNPFPPGQSDNVVKTPEQLMQELQEMQQQQQQYQDQLNPANQNPQQ